MIKGRTVGTLTAGIVLVIYGILFLSHLVFPGIRYSIIMSLWPIIFILLGIEIIISYVANSKEKMKYDIAAIVLIIILSFFAMGMGVAEVIINNYPTFVKTF